MSEFISNFLCRPQMLATLGNVMKFGVQQRLFAQVWWEVSGCPQQTRLPSEYFEVFIFSRRSRFDAADVRTDGISCTPPPPTEQGHDDHRKSTLDLYTVSIKGGKTITAAHEGTGLNRDRRRDLLMSSVTNLLQVLK